MWPRLLVPALGVFWAVMSLLLWRAEYGNADFQGTPLHPDVVWRRILTSPDSSSLAILRRGERIGFCHLITGVAEQFDATSPTNMPEGLVRSIKGYKLDLSGTLNSPDEGLRIRFDGHMTLEQNFDWESFRLQVIARPLTFDIDSTRVKGLVHVKIDGPGESIHRVLRLDQLGNPQTAFAEFFGPAGPVMLNALPFSMPETGIAGSENNVRWVASTDRIKIGRTTAQIYRLELKPMKGYQVSILVSRAGEILKVELPEKLVLANEALSGF